ncbi:MAG: nicotinate (nicotinamide) nucleotide adenylyltransferase [Bryobacteraceae bacterium]|nr:nicotinate (nicotinamide) nucleotide adenylyltransferase [Bryobacteraceae bacterium]
MRLAIFGGTFDPVHNAHLAVARAARRSFGLDRVLMIPAAVPPHKQDRLGAPYDGRLAMVRLACEGESWLEASDLEAGTLKSYSVDTIAKVRASLSLDARLFFIIGADAFAEIRSWFRWHDVVAAVEFIVVTRPGHTYSVPEGATVHGLDSVQLDISSSGIREQLARGEPPPELAPQVFAFIRDQGLYGFGSACGEQPLPGLKQDPVSG